MTQQAWNTVAQLAASWIRDAETAGNVGEAERLRTVIWQQYETIRTEDNGK